MFIYICVLCVKKIIAVIVCVLVGYDLNIAGCVFYVF